MISKGVLLFAQNNQDIDYVQMARFCSSKIKKHLDLPVSLVTSGYQRVEKDKDIFDQIIEIDEINYYNKKFSDGFDFSKKLAWKNTSRDMCYELSPYHETLVLDTDYIINSDTLSLCWKQHKDFLIYKSASDLASWRSDQDFKNLNDYSIPFYWATAFWFRKSKITEMFFGLVAHVRKHWNYYKIIYWINSENFRNDYAFSIAIHMMNGFVVDSFHGFMPGTMYYTLDIDTLIAMDEDRLHFLIQKSQGSSDMIHAKTDGLDVHVMNKYSLLRNIPV